MSSNLEALRAKYRRQRQGLLLAAVLLAAGAAVAGMPRQVMRLVVRAGLPGPLELTPRQLPWSGVLEHDGGLVDDPALPMQVNLRGADGGVVWSESVVTSVSSGRFTVELGDTTPLPAELLASNLVELEVRVGASQVALPRQRLLSVPYSLRSSDVIPANRTYNVGAGGDFATLAEALAWLQPKVVRGAVLLQLMSGTHVLPAGGLRFDHPDARRIRIRGNTTDPTQVVLTASGPGITVATSLAELSGFRLVGSGGASTVGVQFGPQVTCSPGNLHVEGFETPFSVADGSSFFYFNVRLTGLGTQSGTCFDVRGGSHVHGANLTLSSCQVGLRASDRSGINVSGGSMTSVAEGAVASRGSLVGWENVAFQIADAGLAFHATLNSFIAAAPQVTLSNVATVSDPPYYTVGNVNSYIVP